MSPQLRLLPAALAAAAIATASSPAAANPLDLPDWDLVFNDEFDGPSVDTSKWLVLNRQDSFNNEKQYYREEQVTVDNGHLVLTAVNQPLANKQYRSGLVDSHQQWSHGRFEARIDLPTSQGMWPAFWLLPDTSEVPWPSGGEIDIMENRGSQPGLVSSAYHWGPDFFGRQFLFEEYTATQPNGQPENFHDSFHTYAVEWEPDSLRFEVDGNVYHTITSSQAELFDTPKSIILNLAVGGDFGGDPNGSTVWPQEMRVDYVRVWQRPDDYVPPVFLNGSFDESNGSLAGWTDYGNTTGNVSVNDQIAFDEQHSLKLFGQFSGQPNESGVFQNVPVTEGTTVDFAAHVLSPTFDSIAGTDNELQMKIEFYDRVGGDYNSSDLLGEWVETVLDGNTTDTDWTQRSLQAIAPEGAVEARLVFSFLQPDNQAGAAWIDAATLTLTEPGQTPALAGDFNDNGQVEQADLNLVLNNWGRSAGPIPPEGWNNTQGLTGLVDQDELNAVLNNWGSAASPDLQGFAIPEPAAISTIASLLALGVRRRER
ncbi:MAG: glycoside hydrolase family 16 protein [Planctomycetota bacterium]